MNQNTASRDTVGQDPNEAAKEKIADWLTQYVANLTGIDSCAVERLSTFDRYGIDSYHGVVMAYELGDWLGCELEMSEAFDHPSIEDLATYLSSKPKICAMLAERS